MMRRVKHPRTSPTALALAVMLALEVGLTGACATGVDRLPPLDRRFYEVLASDTDRKDFLGPNRQNGSPSSSLEVYGTPGSR